MGVLTLKLKGSTLVESLISMIVITLCFCIGTMICMNVLQSDHDRLHLKAVSLLNEESLRIKKEKEFIDFEKKVSDDWTITSHIEKYPGTQNAFLMKLGVFDKNGKNISYMSEIISE